jgi:hypothetical protein
VKRIRERGGGGKEKRGLDITLVISLLGFDPLYRGGKPIRSISIAGKYVRYLAGGI